MNKFLKRWWILLLLITTGVYTSVSAQTGDGQIIVWLFDDRNANGVRDINEPAITRGIVVNLLDAESVIIASALLDDSPNAARGIVGFQGIASGTYTIQISSPEYTATTDSLFTREIQPGSIPLTLEFGGQRVDLAAETVATVAPNRGPVDNFLNQFGDRTQVGRVALSLAAALLVAAIMSIIGFIIYIALLRPRYHKAMRQVGYQTGTFPSVWQQTGQYPAVPVNRPATGVDQETVDPFASSSSFDFDEFDQFKPPQDS